jgi:hypothetical protein
MAACATNTGHFSLINNTTETIVRASVTICGQTVELKDIQPGERVSASYEVRGDSHHVIRVEFQSGMKLEKDGAYVTSGMNFWDDFIVSRSDIVLENREIR